MTTVPRPPVELTTVGDVEAVFHVRRPDGGVEADVISGLTPDQSYERHGLPFRTLSRPAGELRTRFATVNDIHFGETECGRLGTLTSGPIVRPPPGAAPYPLTMSRAAVAEIAARDLSAVIVKGDLTSAARPDEFESFRACYARFDERLHVVRGNHDAVDGRTDHVGDQWIGLPGVSVALLDTAIPDRASGTLRSDQLDWLDASAAAATDPVIVMGHHQQWVGGERSPTYFGLHPDASDGLADVIARQPAIVAYTAGHTHRHRKRTTAAGVPTIEVGCVKDFPGTWAEYRVYDGGILQVVHRMSSPEALAWSEACRVLYSDFGIDYTAYAMGALDDRCFVIPLR